MDGVEAAIRRLQTASEMALARFQQPIVICISGGKDSSVLCDLARKAKIPFEAQHNHTTADAPETVYFIRKQLYELECVGIRTKINYPVYKGRSTSLWALMREKMIPPTRLQRYCCTILKEATGRGSMIATGVRWEESIKRRNTRGIYENYAAKIKDKVILQTDNDEERRIFEQCNLRGGMICNPIIDWTDREIWEYLRAERVDTNPLYACGFERVGCIGCPMAGKTRCKEFARWPRYKELYISAFDDIVRRRKAAGKRVDNAWRDGKALFLWWMEDKNVDGQLILDGMEDDDER